MQLYLDFQVTDLHDLVSWFLNECDISIRNDDLTVLYAVRTKLSNALAVQAMQQVSSVPTVPSNGVGESYKPECLVCNIPFTPTYDSHQVCHDCFRGL